MYNPFWVLLNSAFWQDDDLDDRVKAARAGAPADIVTKLTRLLVKALTSILIILLPIAKLTSAVAGCLIVFTIGFLSFVFLIVWLPLYHINSNQLAVAESLVSPADTNSTRCGNSFCIRYMGVVDTGFQKTRQAEKTSHV